MATVGLNVGRFEAFSTSLVFWDLGGAASLRGIWEKYYKDTHAIIYVVDAADPDRFEEAKVTAAVTTAMCRIIAQHLAAVDLKTAAELVGQ
jgi:signal recognition particle receptor subunit beta